MRNGVLKETSRQLPDPMPVVVRENAAERTFKVVRLKDLDVGHVPDRAPANALPALEPRRIEQAVVARADEPTSSRRHRQHFPGLSRTERERLLHVDVRARL